MVVKPSSNALILVASTLGGVSGSSAWSKAGLSKVNGPGLGSCSVHAVAAKPSSTCLLHGSRFSDGGGESRPIPFAGGVEGPAT